MRGVVDKCVFPRQQPTAAVQVLVSHHLARSTEISMPFTIRNIIALSLAITRGVLLAQPLPDTEIELLPEFESLESQISDNTQSRRNTPPDWSSCNYSSDSRCTWGTVVRYSNKTYDPITFKGGYNDSFGKDTLFSTVMRR